MLINSKPNSNSNSNSNSNPKLSLWFDAAIFIAILLLAIFWDNFENLDLIVAHQYGTAQGFPLKNNQMLQFWFHDVMQNTARGILLIGVVMIWRPIGIFKYLRKADRVHLVLATVLASVLIIIIKRLSPSNCPYSLSEFGGTGYLLGHWQWLTAIDSGGGHCFPGGHSSSGFAFMAAAYWLRSASARWSTTVWCLASGVGLFLGWIQQLRGAHFISHALWSWVLCAAVAIIYFHLIQIMRRI